MRYRSSLRHTPVIPINSGKHTIVNLSVRALPCIHCFLLKTLRMRTFLYSCCLGPLVCVFPLLRPEPKSSLNKLETGLKITRRWGETNSETVGHACFLLPLEPSLSKPLIKDSVCSREHWDSPLRGFLCLSNPHTNFFPPLITLY